MGEALGGAVEGGAGAHVLVFAVGEAGEAEGDVGEVLFVLVLDEELGELGGDAFLAGESVGEGFGGGVGVAVAGLFEEGEDFFHVFLGESGEGFADAIEDLDIGAVA